MHPYSGFLHDLNADDNLSREASQLTRVGVASVAHNFFWAGPARVIAPDQADLVADLLYGSAYGLLFWSNYLLASADPMDFAAVEQGLSLLALSGHLLSVDPMYCSLVSSLTAWTCIANDGLVPYTSQEYPNAPNLYLGQDNDGPVHTRERQASEAVLYHALVNYVGVPDRSSGGGSGGGSGTGSGGGSGGSESGGAGGPGGSVIDPGVVLDPGAVIDSPNGFYHLIYQYDGNFVLYDADWVPLWATGTDGTSVGFVVMQHDGNLVLYDGAGVPRWASGTHDYPGAHLAVQDDGNVVVYGVDGSALWATHTSR
jgi:hypothetical protein